jgi:hypothetical protein
MRFQARSSVPVMLFCPLMARREKPQADRQSNTRKPGTMTDLNKLRTLSLVRQEGAATLTATISPCCFMYPRYGLQISVDLNGKQRAIKHGNQDMSTVTEADVQALFESVRTIPCVACGADALDGATIQTNKHGLCEACMMAMINAEFEADEEVRQQELESRKRRAKAEGFTHMVSGFIHRDCGDDEMISFFANDPTEEGIRAQLSKAGSVIDTDYRIDTL